MVSKMFLEQEKILFNYLMSLLITSSKFQERVKWGTEETKSMTGDSILYKKASSRRRKIKYTHLSTNSFASFLLEVVSSSDFDKNIMTCTEGKKKGAK